jgi:hypothetical protein
MKSAHIFACPPKFTPILTAIMVAPYFPKFTPILTVIMGEPYFPSLSSLPQVTVSSPLSRLSPPCSPHAVGPHLASDVCAPYGSIPTPLWLEGPFFAHIEVKRDRSPLAVLPMANDVVAGQCMVVGAVCEHTKTDCIFLQLRLLFMAEAQRTKATFFYPPASPHVWCSCREICVMCSS